MGVEGESTQTATRPVDGGDADIALNIRCSNGNKFSVRASLRSTVVAFKDLLAQNCDVPANQQRLIYKGRILKDDQTLESYGLQADHTIHMVRGSAQAPAPTPIAPNANAPTQGVGLGGLDPGAPLFPGVGAGWARRVWTSRCYSVKNVVLSKDGDLFVLEFRTSHNWLLVECCTVKICAENNGPMGELHLD